jgi:hypothetical protein
MWQAEFGSILIAQATYSSKTSVHFQRTTWRYILEDKTLHDNRCEYVKSDKFVIALYCGVFAPCKNGWVTETAAAK